MNEDERRAAETAHRLAWVPYPPEMTRERIKTTPIEERCDPSCPMWFIDNETFEITRCDDCCVKQDDALTDLDMARLPEAIAERRKARRAERRKQRPGRKPTGACISNGSNFGT
jgi:hypothetical protein